MGFFEISLLLATVLCSLVAGFLFAFAVVVMPGINRLNNRGFLRAFRVMDRIIQDNDPFFMIVWVGSIVFLIVSVVLGFNQLNGLELFLLIAGAFIYIAGVQLPTLIVNVPLNNKLQSLDIDAINDSELISARNEFETRWNKWNNRRTVLSCLSSLLLILLIFKI